MESFEQLQHFLFLFRILQITCTHPEFFRKVLYDDAMPRRWRRVLKAEPGQIACILPFMTIQSKETVLNKNIETRLEIHRDESSLQRDATMSRRRGIITASQPACNGTHTVASVLFRRSKVGFTQVKQSPDFVASFRFQRAAKPSHTEHGCIKLFHTQKAMRCQ